MPVRVYSTIPGYEHCYVEVADAWTVREVVALSESRDRWLELWRSKVLGCHIATADGGVLSDAEAVVERFDDLDIRLARFINSALHAAVDHLATLGGTQRRISSGAGESPTTTRAPTT